MGRKSLRIAALSVALLFLLLLHAGLPAAQGSPSSFTQTCIITGTVTTPEGCILSAIPYMFIGVLLSFMIIALVYMLGNVMQFRSMQNWYRAELWEAIKTIIVMGVIISSLVIVSAIANILVGNQYAAPFGNTPNALSMNLANLYNTDNSYVTGQLNSVYQAFGGILGLSTASAISKLQLSLWVPLPLFWPFPPEVFGSVQFGIAGSPLLSTNFITAASGQSSYSITQNITDIVIVPMLIIFQTQASYFYYIVMLGLGVLIPIGIIFRAFPLIRDIGGTLIATGIGLAIIYPSLLLLFNLPISNYIYSFTYTQTGMSSCPFSSGMMCELWNASISGISQPDLLSGTSSAYGTAAALVATSPVLGMSSPVLSGDILKFPLLVALGSSAASNANVVGAMYEGAGVGFTPLVAGLYPTLNFIIDETLGVILQFILFALDILIGLIITGAITQMLGGKVRLGFGKKLSFRSG